MRLLFSLIYLSMLILYRGKLSSEVGIVFIPLLGNILIAD